MFCSGSVPIIVKTRKSSCVNARGLPTVAYQVLLRWGIPPVGVSPPHWGTPQPGLRGYLRWGTPHQGTPGQILLGGVPEVGYPPARSDGGTPIRVTPIGVSPSQVWRGTQGGTLLARGTPWQDLAGVPPPAAWTWLGYPPPTPGVDRQMDRQESKHNLPVVLRTRSVKIVKWTYVNAAYRENERSVITSCYCYYLQREESNAVVVVFKRAAWRLFPPGTRLLPAEPSRPAVRIPNLW